MQGGGYPPQGPQGPNQPGGFGQPPNPYGGYGGGYGPPPPQPGMPMVPVPQPGAPYGIDPVTGLPFSDKSKVVAGLLQLFFGVFGVGRFYTGHTGIAIGQIFLCWITCGIWAFVDAILMFMGKVKDAQGRPLRDGF